MKGGIFFEEKQQLEWQQESVLPSVVRRCPDGGGITPTCGHATPNAERDDHTARQQFGIFIACLTYPWYSLIKNIKALT